MERPARVANAIVASIASRPSQKPLILCTIVATVSEETVRIVLQSHAEGSSLRGVSRMTGLQHRSEYHPSRQSEGADDSQCSGKSCRNRGYLCR